MSTNETSRQRKLQLLAALSAAVAATCPVAAMANPANCSVWSASQVYTVGAIVLDQGKTYVANWWTQGNEPVTNSGGSGSGQAGSGRQSCQLSRNGAAQASIAPTA